MSRDWGFAITFVVGLTLTLYFLGTSITGLMVQSMYCDQGECKEFCRFTSDCTGVDEMCCDVNGYGVCEYVLDCGKNYEFNIESDVENLPTLEQPAPILEANIALYSGLLFIFVLIAIPFFKYKKLRLRSKR